MTVPAPAAPVRIRAATAASHGTSPACLTAIRTPGLAAIRNSAELSSSAPSSMPRPCATNDVFMRGCRGEQTLRPSKTPQLTAPRSLMSPVRRLYRSGPAQAPITAASATKYWTTLSTAHAPMYCRVEAVSGRNVPRTEGA